MPANRIGYTKFSLPQLKTLQEAITLAVFLPFAPLYMQQPLKLDYLLAALCIMGAVYFIFRSRSQNKPGAAIVRHHPVPDKKSCPFPNSNTSSSKDR